MAKKKHQPSTIQLKPELCPCGCPNVILSPIFRCQCSSIDQETAHELEIRINYFERMFAAIKELIKKVGEEELEAIVEEVEALRKQKPVYKQNRRYD